MDDREWMYMGHRSAGDFTDEWMMKTNDFLEMTFAQAFLVLCPYMICANIKKEEQGGHG
jgi:hypothetical protein